MGIVSRFTLALTGLFLALFFLYPLGVLFVRGLTSAPLDSAFDAFLIHVIGFTYLQALASTALSAVIGMAGAMLYADSRGILRRILSALTWIPFSLPPILAALGLLGVWGRNGMAAPVFSVLGEWNGIYGWPGILLGHALFNFPLFIQLVGPALVEGDRTLEKVALSLGASRLRCFATATWPRIRPAFCNAALLAFLFSSASFLIVLILGGSPRFTTIEVAIYQAIKHDLDVATAVRMALLQMGVATALMGFWFRPRPRLADSRDAFSAYRFRSRISRYFAETAFGVLLAVLVLLPLGWIVAQGLGAVSDVSIWAGALWVSVKLCFFSGALSVGVALPAAYGARRSETIRRWAGWVFTLPLAVSSLLILLGWRLAFPAWGQGNLSLFLGVAVVQTLVALPVVYRPLEDGFSRIPDEWYRLSASLGAGPWQRFFWVEWPALRGALASGFFLGAAISIGEAGAVLLFPSEATSNLTHLIYQQMSRYRFEEAYASATVLLALTALLAGATGFFQREVTA